MGSEVPIEIVEEDGFDWETAVKEIGDKTFFAAAILAMRYPRRLVLAGCVLALIVMTILSATVGWAAPNLEETECLVVLTSLRNRDIYKCRSWRGSYAIKSLITIDINQGYVQL